MSDTKTNSPSGWLDKLARLTTDFNELADLDRHVSSREKRSFALMMACRPWVFSMFDGLRKR